MASNARYKHSDTPSHDAPDKLISIFDRPLDLVAIFGAFGSLLIFSSVFFCFTTSFLWLLYGFGILVSVVFFCSILFRF